ncbi:MAG: hypothetical protein FWB87_06895 [Defluviitaleaceae bacterium]|nr:hypothetical protein [Defluviitaleaceae bacterium]
MKMKKLGTHACLNIGDHGSRLIISKRYWSENKHRKLTSDEKRFLRSIGAVWNPARKHYFVDNPHPVVPIKCARDMSYEEIFKNGLKIE